MYLTIANHIELDREQRSVRKNGQEIHLTGLEYGLLEFLSAHPNRICTRQMLLDHVWGIGEVFKQRERVRKGWFPMNPKRKNDY